MFSTLFLFGILAFVLYNLAAMLNTINQYKKYGCKVQTIKDIMSRFK